jgi:hypothetical protein
MRITFSSIVAPPFISNSTGSGGFQRASIGHVDQDPRPRPVDAQRPALLVNELPFF